MTTLPKFLVERISENWIDRLYPGGWQEELRSGGGRGQMRSEAKYYYPLTLIFPHFRNNY